MGWRWGCAASRVHAAATCAARLFPVWFPKPCHLKTTPQAALSSPLPSRQGFPEPTKFDPDRMGPERKVGPLGLCLHVLRSYGRALLPYGEISAPAACVTVAALRAPACPSG